MINRALKMLQYYCAAKIARFFLPNQAKQKQSIFKRLKNYSFYQDKIIKNFDQIPIINVKTQRENFKALNHYGISNENAIAAAKGEIKLINGLVAGFSTGTGGQNRGLFLTSQNERINYIAQILAKALSFKELLKVRKIALCLRAENSLYDEVGKGRINFRFFPLSTERETIAQQIKEFAPDILIAPTQILLCMAQNELKWPNLFKIFYGAENMNLFEREYIKAQIGLNPLAIYQATEGFLGLGCENGNIHLNTDNIIFEREKIDKTRFFPIISDTKRQSQAIFRLKLDDILSEVKCDCGNKLPAIKSIERKNDIWEYCENHYPNQIEMQIASRLKPFADWVIMASEAEIIIYAQSQSDFTIIADCLKKYNRPIKYMPYSRTLDFPKRRHIRWQ